MSQNLNPQPEIGQDAIPARSENASSTTNLNSSAISVNSTSQITTSVAENLWQNANVWETGLDYSSLAHHWNMYSNAFPSVDGLYSNNLAQPGETGILATGDYQLKFEDHLGHLSKDHKDSFKKPQSHSSIASTATKPSSSGINQLGGHYANGRPLSEDLRKQIISLAKQNVKPCQISRELKISHGCVSKILSKYNKTGSIRPGTIGGSKPRVAKEAIINKIVTLKKANPQLFAWEIKKSLEDDNACGKGNSAPSISSINRILRQNYKPDSNTELTLATTKTLGSKNGNQNAASIKNLKTSHLLDPYLMSFSKASSKNSSKKSYSNKLQPLENMFLTAGVVAAPIVANFANGLTHNIEYRVGFWRQLPGRQPKLLDL